MAEPAVVLHGPSRLVAALADHTGLRVVSADRAREVAGAPAVVGVAAEPWPAFAEAHERAREAVGAAPYYAVQAWHQHPAHLDAVADAVSRGRAAVGADVHVLFTAPGPAADPEPQDVVFLREVAEAVTQRLGLTRRSIAWVGGESGPSTHTALGALVEAHGYQEVLRVSLDPLGRPDGVHAEASSLDVELHEVHVDAEALVEALRQVVATVVAHEQLGGSP